MTAKRAGQTGNSSETAKLLSGRKRFRAAKLPSGRDMNNGRCKRWMIKPYFKKDWKNIMTN